jgi:phosphotriesterase-related protein
MSQGPIQRIETVTGSIAPQDLGRTLMHEHLTAGFAGYEANTSRPGQSFEERVAVCIDQIHRLRDLGFTSMLDPCPNDLGREVELMAKVSQDTHFNIVFATGLYKESSSGSPYWKFRANFGGDQSEPMAELFIHELRRGVGDTGIKAGIIKVASDAHQITDYEMTILKAAALASNETGAPITTHTDEGTMGDEQQRILISLGVPAHRIIIGHCCATDDHEYHMHIAKQGSYLGFDRFGLENVFPDEKRIASLVRLIQQGAGDRVIVSNDSVWCWRGEYFVLAVAERMRELLDPTHFTRIVMPKLLEAGVTQQQLDSILVDNPRRFFSGEALPSDFGQL